MLRRATLLATLLAWVVAQVPQLLCLHGDEATVTTVLLAQAHLNDASARHAPRSAPRRCSKHGCGHDALATEAPGRGPDEAPEHDGGHAIVIADLVLAGARAELPQPLVTHLVGLGPRTGSVLRDRPAAEVPPGAEGLVAAPDPAPASAPLLL